MGVAKHNPVEEVLAMLPAGLFLMTAAYEGKRAGHIVRSVQVCSEIPVLICVAARKGHSIAPLIRDSHRFAICIIPPAESPMLRRFEMEIAPDEMGDTFDALSVETLRSQSPIPKRSLAALDCEVVRHFDLEADHELFIGSPIAARVYRSNTTA
ncbi:MAG: flavin reductase [Phycisphaeraceae bacterium]|nr:flavin reductase [Phycisphaeraceae bacterium]